MAVVFMDASMKGRFLERIGKLEENSARQWGTMEPIQMVAHLRQFGL